MADPERTYGRFGYERHQDTEKMLPSGSVEGEVEALLALLGDAPIGAPVPRPCRAGAITEAERERNYQIQQEAYERGQEMLEEDRETQDRLVGELFAGALSENLPGKEKPE